MTAWYTGLKVLIIVASTVLVWRHMIYTADISPEFFSDEIGNNQCAVSFFKNGALKSDRYGLHYSSGIVVIWPGAVGWNMGHNLLDTRISCAFFAWLGAVVLGLCFFRRCGLGFLDALAAAVCLWAVTVTPPLAMPYWLGFMYNLAELNSAVLLGFGALCICRWPMLGAFILGTAVWHGKLIYFPFAGAFLLGDALSRKLSFILTFKMLLRYALMFLLPLFLWIGWLFSRFGNTGLGNWVVEQWGYVDYRMGFLNLPSSTGNSFGESWRGRFQSARLEWHGYTLGAKCKNLLFSVGAIGVALFGLSRGMYKKMDISSREKWVSIFLVIGIACNSVYYFFFHPTMWQRHFQPSLYIGLGLLIFWCVKWVRFSGRNWEGLFYTLAVCVVILQGLVGLRHPLLSPVQTYARSCTDLYSRLCDPVLYK